MVTARLTVEVMARLTGIRTDMRMVRITDIRITA
jgi:hypothetical protein